MHPENKQQLAALKAIAKAFKINFKAEERNEREAAINLYGKEAV